jgi:hypothetical protein
MIFTPHEQHSIAQIQRIEGLISQSTTIETALFIVVQLTQHGDPRAKELLLILKENFKKSRQAGIFFERLLLQDNFISAIPDWTAIQKKTDIKNLLYGLNGYHFFKGKKHPKKLLVIFTTMYNNFYMSNPVLFALLAQFGISILILKDATRFNYLKGVKGLGNDPSQLSKSIMTLAKTENIDDIYITGFSSGGYASLLCSSLITCKGYLGFSISSDLSKNSSLSIPKFFTEEVSSQIPDQWLLDLKQILVNNPDACQRSIIYGLDSEHDTAHATQLSGVPNLTLHGLDNCGHITVGYLMAQHELTQVFLRFVFES